MPSYDLFRYAPTILNLQPLLRKHQIYQQCANFCDSFVEIVKIQADKRKNNIKQ